MSELTFEQSLQQLEQIVSQLERGEVPVEEALDACQKGMVLYKQCKDQLANAEKTLAKMMTDANQEVPFEEAKNE